MTWWAHDVFYPAATARASLVIIETHSVLYSLGTQGADSSCDLHVAGHDNGWCHRWICDAASSRLVLLDSLMPRSAFHTRGPRQALTATGETLRDICI